MQTMITFSEWFLNNIPDFLWSDAIKPLWALLLVGYIVRIILDFRR